MTSNGATLDSFVCIYLVAARSAAGPSVMPDHCFGVPNEMCSQTEGLLKPPGLLTSAAYQEEGWLLCMQPGSPIVDFSSSLSCTRRPSLCRAEMLPELKLLRLDELLQGSNSIQNCSYLWTCSRAHVNRREGGSPSLLSCRAQRETPCSGAGQGSGGCVGSCM